MYLEKYNLKGRLAVVTGGGQAIGLACVEALAEAGAKVVIADHNAAVAEQGRDEMKRKGYACEIANVDVTDSKAIEALADQLGRAHGNVDILINNAGIARSEIPGENMEDERWLNVLDVNLNGTFWCCRSFGKRMLAAGKGSIVNVGSMSGFIVNKPQEQSHYNASKAAVHHLTRSLAAEWGARGVRVNAVAPTYIDTPMVWTVEDVDAKMKDWIRDTPMGRLGKPEEIASVVHFLASDAASLLTGSIVLADGGFTSW
jgi:NAD(P)-dependent dehydrogenase (short-subunit alcohol dehydrogenase family)